MKFISQDGMKESYSQEQYKAYGKDVIGPIVYKYVLWILYQAQKNNLRTLYFLSRDGYLLQQVAKELCHKWNIPVECKYLYCSRMALRMSTYFFIGDEAYDLLLQGGYYITPYILLKRLNLSEEEREQVYRDIGEVGEVQENEALTNKEFKVFIEKLKSSKVYKKHLDNKSKQSYHNTIGYFKQEGLFNNKCVGIVDSGWSGSIQRSLRQLLESAGYDGSIIGYYFGLYNKPKQKKDGKYQTYYFDNFYGLKNKLYFDNAWFECILAAPHGMTIGYNSIDGTFVPILKDNINEINLSIIQSHIRGAMEYIKNNARKEALDKFNKKESVRSTYKILKRAVVFPTQKEVDMFGYFRFCDDVSEARERLFVRKDMMGNLKNYMFIPKLKSKIMGKGKNVPIDDVFWPYSLVSYIPFPKCVWYRWNMYVFFLCGYFRIFIKEVKIRNNE